METGVVNIFKKLSPFSRLISFRVMLTLEIPHVALYQPAGSLTVFPYRKEKERISNAIEWMSLNP